MFRHTGRRRTFRHNLRLASMLSFVSGIVNITGLLSIGILTTNITGHFAFFSEEVTKASYSAAFVYLFYIVSFLLGAFFSNLIAELLVRYRKTGYYAAPILVEIVILSSIALYLHFNELPREEAPFIACALLFAMGLQNALVTKVSGSVVRTTHLTGIFTDLGIELSLLLSHKNNERRALKKSVSLKLVIILFFLLGGLLGGLLYLKIGSDTLFAGCLCLIFASFYDYIRLQYYAVRRKTKMVR
jgi:uncharacterized membrane protein YoaK (UPF0700 family)